MREFINKVTITGVLVKNGLEFKTKDNNEYIGGDLVIRTSDGSEHEVGLFSYKYKKDATGNFTDEVSKLYTAYETILNDYKSIEKFPDEPDVITIKKGTFSVNDYKNTQDNKVVTYNQLSTRFVERVEKKDIDTTVQEGKFEVEGVIDSIKDEIVKDVPTGSLIVTLNVITQNSEGKGKEKKYTINDMFPLKLTVTDKLAPMFQTAGYYEGAFVKFVGKLINTVEMITTTEKQAFGEDLIKTFAKTTKRFEIVSGNSPVTVYDVELTDDIINQLISKRKEKINKALAGRTTNTSITSAPFDTTPASNTSTTANPFKNPFAK